MDGRRQDSDVWCVPFSPHGRAHTPGEPGQFACYRPEPKDVLYERWRPDINVQCRDCRRKLEAAGVRQERR